MKVHGYAAHSPTQPLVPFDFERRQPRADDVVIEILYCGVCHSDLHHSRNDWGGANYPIVPGHEIVGRVQSVGPTVTRFKIGDQVAVGCMVDSCRHCSACDNGLEQYCAEGATFTYNGLDRIDRTRTRGGYSDHIIVADQFVLKVPKGLDLAGTAPLLCAGVTTWSPLRHWNVGRDSKVAVIGLGGLGHMALKLAKALGADVTLLSRSPAKTDDALRLGADRVLLTTDPTQMSAVKGQFDLILDTVPYEHDLNPYIPTLAVDGTLVLLGFIGKFDSTLTTGPMIFGRRTIAGSLIGGVDETQELLDFCGEHNITSDIEIIRMQDINTAFERMQKSDVKYRFVIDMATLKN
jgi:uncharacterized zinc-type alcohol dehydrogenase-like protein